MQKTEYKSYDKKNTTFYTVLGIIGDIIFYPVIIISLLSSCFMFLSKKEGKVPQFSGVSLVRILSRSMENSDFYRGDSVIVKRVNTDDLKVGDIIAFYYYRDSVDTGLTLTVVADKDKDERNEFVANENFSVTGRTERNKLNYKKISVYFHHIERIFYDEGGTAFFQTKGSSNSGVDSYKIREDLVVGRYVHTPDIIRNIIRFCSTAMGMIILVVTPLSILILLQSLSIIEQINNIVLERKVLERKEDWNTEEAFKANIGIEMDVTNKVYFYAIIPEKERQEVWSFLWGYLANQKDKKSKELYSLAEKSKSELEKGAEVYFKFWRTNLTKNRDLRKLSKVELRYEYDNLKPLNNKKG